MKNKYVYFVVANYLTDEEHNGTLNTTVPMTHKIRTVADVVELRNYILEQNKNFRTMAILNWIPLKNKKS